MEIERKYLIDQIPFSLEDYPCLLIEQGYLSTSPVVRVRRQNDDFYLTYKSSGLMTREEYNLPLNEDAYHHLIQKADGIIITKKRYLIPLNSQYADLSPNPAGQDLTIELDIFEGEYQGLCLAEVEFATEDDANSFTPPSWFGEDVTFSSKYHNSNMSQRS